MFVYIDLMNLRTQNSLFCLILIVFCASVYAQDTSYKSRKIVVIGEDSRLTPGAIPNNDKYKAAGLVTCDKPNAKPTDVYASSGTATLVENNQTLITSAHTFVNKSGQFITDIRKYCFFHILNNSGKVMQTIGIADMITPDDLSASALDAADKRQNDWAVIKLKIPATDVTPFQIARDTTVNVNDSIKLCSYSHDLPNYSVKRCLTGKYKNNGMDSPIMRNPMALYHDIDTNGASSGGALFVERNGVPLVFGIHKGGLCKPGERVYDIDTCSNDGIFFSKEAYKALDTIVEETGGSIYGPAKVQKTKFITPVPANPNREVST
jgi:hypothetical protein